MSSGTAAPVLRSKNTVVPVGTPGRGQAGRRRGPGGLIRRTALVRRLSEADAPLAVLVAPPGYGKTTLLVQWAEQDERPVVWLAFDERTGHDPEKAAGAIVDRLAEADLLDFEPPAGEARDALRAAIASLRERRRDFILVLDDAHRADGQIVRELVDIAIEESGGRTIVALASRGEPPLPLGRLRASRALVEIRVEDLAMLPAEASVLLRRAGVDLDFGVVQGIVQRTEGWPGGLYLAARSLCGQVDITGAASELRGDDHALATYFREEVLSTLPQELREFAILSSVLDELSGPVCDAVLDRRGSALVLAELEYATPLLRPLDPAHEQYRWHALFRETLAAELRRTEPERSALLHARASGCYQKWGDIDHAIEHAVRGHDAVRTGELLWANVIAYLTRGRHELVRSWLSAFNDEELRANGPLALCAAHCFLASGSAAMARHWAVTGVAAIGRDQVLADDPPVPGLVGIKAMVEHPGIAAMGEAAARALDSEAEDSPWHPIWLFVRGTALHLIGDRAAAAPLLEQGADLSATVAPIVTCLSLAQAAMVAIEEEEWEGAAELTDRSRQVIEDRGLGDYPIAALAFAASAAVRAHHGRVDEAKQDLRTGIDLLAALGDFVPWYSAEARILLAHASLWLADVVGARTLLAEASRLARRTPEAVIFARWFDDAWSYMDSLAETSLAGPSSLTIAELRILRFLPSHRSFREIAAQLGVSANTVKTQAHAVYRKLGAASRSEAVARASDAGLLGQ